MEQSIDFGLRGYRQQVFFAQDGTNKILKVESLKKRFLIEGSVVMFHRMQGCTTVLSVNKILFWTITSPWASA